MAAGWAGRASRSGAIDFGSRTAETSAQLHASSSSTRVMACPATGGVPSPPRPAPMSGAARYAWPPASHSDRHALPGAPEGALGFEPPVAGEAASTSYVSDPARPVPYVRPPTRGVRPDYRWLTNAFAATRPDACVFEGPALERDLSVAAPGDASTGTDADFVAR